jgi:hypothetical protein
MKINNIYFILIQHFWRRYYLATPIFIFLDAFFNISIRIPFLDNWPLLKYIYYVLIFVCGIFITKFPKLAKKIVMSECYINIVLLCVGYMKPYFMIQDYESLKFATSVYTYEAVICFTLTTGVLYFNHFFGNDTTKQYQSKYK